MALRVDSELLKHFLLEREDEFSFPKEVSVFTTTFNTAALDPIEQTQFREDAARNWLNSAADNDVVVINLQEIVDLNNPYNLTYAADFTTYQYFKEWENVLLAILNRSTSKQKYRMLSSASLVGLAQYVFITESMAEHAFDVRKFVYGCGFMGIGGNKGAVGIAFTLFDAPLVFINCHLSAGDSADDRERRCQDLSAILENARFDAVTATTDDDGASTTDPDNDAWKTVPGEKASSPSPFPSPSSSTPPPPPAAESDADIISRVQEEEAEQRYWRLGRQAATDLSRAPLSARHDVVVVAGDFNSRLNLSTSASACAAVDIDTTAVVARRGSESETETEHTESETESESSESKQSPSTKTVVGVDPNPDMLDRYAVLRLIDEGKLSALAPYDELYRAMTTKKCNNNSNNSSRDIGRQREQQPLSLLLQTGGFREGEFASFAPTYKYRNAGRPPSTVLDQAVSVVGHWASLGLGIIGIGPDPLAVGAKDDAIDNYKDDYQRPADWEEYMQAQQKGKTGERVAALATATQQDDDDGGGGGGAAASAAAAAAAAAADSPELKGKEKGPKARTPAWCDRILHCTPRADHSCCDGNGKDNEGTASDSSKSIHHQYQQSLVLPARVVIRSYTRSELQWSDHRPVNCTYTFRLKCIDTEKENQLLMQAERDAAVVEAEEEEILSRSRSTSAVLSK